MFTFTTLDGTPIPEWANVFLNGKIKEESDRKMFNKLIHKIEKYFSEWNEEHCTECSSREWQKQRPEFKYSHGCCRDCWGHQGYFNDYEHTGMEERSMLVGRKELFSEVHGFFNESIYGCSLPRHLRSRTCLRYCCDFKKWETIDPIVKKACEIRGFT